MVSYLLSVMVVAATIICKISGQEKYQEHLTSGERESKCQSQQAAGRRHADVLSCSFHVDVNNFHVQFYPEGSFNKDVPDMDVVLSCSSSCEIPEAFKDYIFINQSVFHSSEDHTYTFEVLPSKTTNGSFRCQAFHEADTLFTDFCNVSDHILLTNLTGKAEHPEEESLTSRPDKQTPAANEGRKIDRQEATANGAAADDVITRPKPSELEILLPSEDEQTDRESLDKEKWRHDRPEPAAGHSPLSPLEKVQKRLEIQGYSPEFVRQASLVNEEIKCRDTFDK